MNQSNGPDSELQLSTRYGWLDSGNSALHAGGVARHHGAACDGQVKALAQLMLRL